MAVRRRSSRSRSSRPARYQWQPRQSAAPVVVNAGASAVIDILEDLDAGFQAGITIVRLFLRLAVFASSSGQSTQFQHGVVQTSRKAFVNTQVPTPTVDQVQWYLLDGDQMFRDVDAGPQQALLNYDIRTARKLRGIETTMVHVMENTDSVDNLSYNIFTNALIKWS